jgi:hypothetical protein
MLIAIGLSPFLAGDVARLWVWWKARQENLTVKIDKIDAPFLRPITFRGLHITSSPDAMFRVDLNASQVSVDLNFKRILLRTRGRTIRNISAVDLRAEIHQNANGAPFPAATWTTWQSLLPSNFNLQRVDLRVENGSAVVLLRGGVLNGGRIHDRFTTGAPDIFATARRHPLAG